MIEVPLQDFELKHPALNHTNWFGSQVQWWKAIGLLSQAPKWKLDILEGNLYELLDIISIHFNCPEMKDWVKDFEICGSWAMENQKWWSDLDIQMSCENEVNQRKLMSIITPELHSYYIPEVHKLSLILKIALEIKYGEWKNKEYAECFSLRERKFYNKIPGVPKDRSYHRCWNKDKYKYDVITRPTKDPGDGAYWDKNGNFQPEGFRLKKKYVKL